MEFWLVVLLSLTGPNNELQESTVAKLVCLGFFLFVGLMFYKPVVKESDDDAYGRIYSSLGTKEEREKFRQYYAKKHGL